MTGMVKAKKYDWNDSNMALFGTGVEKNIKAEAADTEEAWQGAGTEPSIKIWRVEQFKIVEWPAEDYGKFYEGDSYIILNTYQVDDSDALLYDVHFWIGKYSTQDEYATAAYKTVELDTFLDDKAVQHREVQSHESDMFQSYFPTMTTMKGGAATGFRHVTEEEYRPRLLLVSGRRRNVTVKEVRRSASKITSGDVFILDMGKTIYQLNGSECNKDERFKAAQHVQQMESERGGAKTVVLDGDLSPDHPFFSHLDEDDVDDDSDEELEAGEKKLLRLSDADGSLDISEVKTGDISRDDLASEDAFIIDTTKEVIVWIGLNASSGEKKKGLEYAHNYLKDQERPWASVIVVREGQRSSYVDAALTA